MPFRAGRINKFRYPADNWWGVELRSKMCFFSAILIPYRRFVGGVLKNELFRHSFLRLKGVELLKLGQPVETPWQYRGIIRASIVML